MASSTKMVTTNINPDLPRQSSVCSLSSLLAEPSKSITMDDILLNSIYSSSEPNPNPEPATATSVPKEKTMDEVWKEMVTGSAAQPQPQHNIDNNNNNEMTLEDFLSNSKPVPSALPLPLTDHDDVTSIIPPPPCTTLPVVGVSPSHPQAAGGGGRGKRRRGAGVGVAVDEAVVDKATLQKQRRMIKNRESAARSRERKQAYTVELESMVVHLEEENARLLREQADRNMQRYKQLMECLIPVVEQRKPRRKLRRVNSVQW